jgi:rod shape-determining protein MreC
MLDCDWSSDVCSSDLRAQNVYPGMPVRAPEGLIGRVNTSGINTADVLLLTDSSNIVPVRRAKDDIAGLSAGRDDGSVEIRSLTAGNNPFKPGDVMVTSGTGGLYSPNIPVAIVVRVEGDVAIGVPLANPARVEAVIVQRPYEASVTRQPAPTAPSANKAPAGPPPPAPAPPAAVNATPEAPAAATPVNQAEPAP